MLQTLENSRYSCVIFGCNNSKSYIGDLQTGIRPAWEDERNGNGGRWFYTLPGGSTGRASSAIDKFWLDMVSDCRVGSDIFLILSAFSRSSFSYKYQ